MMQRQEPCSSSEAKYTIKVCDGRKKNSRLDVDANLTMGQLDDALRLKLKYDLIDHCGAFYDDRGKEIAIIYPGGNSGKGHDKVLSSLGLKLNDRFKYIYDLGDRRESIFEVIKITGLPPAPPKKKRGLFDFFFS